MLQYKEIFYNNFNESLITKEIKKYLKSLLSNTSKMPSKSINRSAFLCHVGAVLSKLEGSTCYKCYAQKGMYRMPNVVNKMKVREEFFNSPNFVPIMIYLINTLPIDKITKTKLFRWFDSGDVDNVKMALNILEIADNTKDCLHWIPSRENKIWKQVKEIRNIPDNVILIISAPMVNGVPSKSFENTSTVNSEIGKFVIGFECQAFRTFKNGNMLSLEEYKNLKRNDPIKKELGNCGNCRTCWNKDIKNRSYPLH